MPKDSEVLSRLDSLQATVEVLARGLTMMTETLGTHSEMLAQILEACTQEPETSPVAEALEKLCGRMEEVAEGLGDVNGSLKGLGATVEMSVIRGMARVIEGVDGDGVVPD